MDFKIFTNLISPIIMIACLNIYPNDKINRFIPLIVAVLGIIFNVWASCSFDFNTLMIGMASGLASTGMYEAFKNLIEK